MSSGEYAGHSAQFWYEDADRLRKVWWDAASERNRLWFVVLYLLRDPQADPQAEARAA